MVRNATLVLFLVAMAGVPLVAQEVGLADVTSEQQSPRAPQLDAAGDVIIFTSGKQLRGLQVLRETPRTVVVQVIVGKEPLLLSKRFIERIDYDDVLPDVEGDADREPESSSPNVIVADRLSGELHRNLNAPLPPGFLESKGEDLVVLLEKLGQAMKVRINITDSVRTMPEGARRWRYKVKKQTSLESLLRENLLVHFDRLKVLYKFDEIVVTTTAPATHKRAAKD